MSLNLKHIAEGWSRHLDLIQTPPEIKELAKQRVKICTLCKHSKEQWLTKIIDGALGKDIEGSGIGCGICGCPVNQKALVPEETCPEHKW